jgi:hypothetical protein
VVAGLVVAGLVVAGLVVAGLVVAGLVVAGLVVAGLHVHAAFSSNVTDLTACVAAWAILEAHLAVLRGGRLVVGEAVEALGQAVAVGVAAGGMVGSVGVAA